jgi:hypothetical protein
MLAGLSDGLGKVKNAQQMLCLCDQVDAFCDEIVKRMLYCY